MKQVCAWCGRDMADVDAEFDAENSIAHGLCDPCARHLLAQRGMPLHDYLQGLDSPVLVVDEDATIITGNGQAAALLHLDLPAIEGFKGGDVFECVYARLPGGCGRTVHCSGCAIRRAIAETAASGRGLIKVAAVLNRQFPGDDEKVDMLISTQKLADVVLLRIDAIGGWAP